MNLKKAKRLRKAVKQMLGETQPDRQLLMHKKTGQVVNDPSSIRGFYRRLKQG